MITTLLNSGLLAQAFSELRRRTAAYPGEGFGDRLDTLQTEFKYMSDFMLQGYKDDRRAALFDDIIQRTAELDYDLQVRETLLENPYIKGAVKALGGVGQSAEALQELLQQPVTKEEHYKNISIAFMSLLTSGHWRQNHADEWAAYIASPTVSPTEAAALTAAIMLSALYHFSYNKVLCLANIYMLSRSEVLRQRAFVGCMLAISEAGVEHKTCVDALLKTIFSDEEAGKMLIEMQVQMTACANAEADGSEINKNIMPDLLRNQPYRFTKDGIVEKEEEKDCINLDADERRMEAMTEGVNKMIEMQKNGSDIFFCGFRQMKRFPFFSRLANWFMPFTFEHPDMMRDASAVAGSDFVEKVVKRGPFCDSDKYSFVIAMSGVLNQLPANVRKMMEEGQVGPLGMQDASAGAPTPSMLRLQYLQDLYRYFRLNSLGSSLPSPFAHVSRYRLWTVACGGFTDAERKSAFTCILRDASLWDEASLAQQGASAAESGGAHPAKVILDSFKDKESYAYLSCYAEYMMRLKLHSDAASAYAKCLKLKPENPTLMRGMARACYGEGEYAKAAFYFDALHTLFPKRVSYVLNYAMAMVMDGAAESVVNDMYKLEYENPDNTMVKNTLGWVLLHARKAEQALSVYEKLMGEEGAAADFHVLLNAFYANLVNGKAQHAIELLRKHCSTLDEKQRGDFPIQLANAMQEDARLLELYAIGKAEKTIILSQLAFFTL